MTNYKILAGLIAATALCSCSSKVSKEPAPEASGTSPSAQQQNTTQSQQNSTAKPETVESQRATIERICAYVEKKKTFNELSAEDQALYRKIYNHELPPAEQAAWDKILEKRIAKNPASSQSNDAKLVGKNVKVPDAPPGTDLKAAAVHIKAAWNKHASTESLTKFEKQMYAAIYYKKLPADKQAAWDKFLLETAAPSRGSTTMMPVSLPGAPN